MELGSNYGIISLLPMVVTFVLINGFGVELLYGLTAGCVLSLLFFCKSLGDYEWGI